MSFSHIFSTFANQIAKAAGRPWAFVLALAVVATWAISGPIFRFSDTWQLVINTGTTIVTFMMVFVIQNTQNRDGMAIQAKLDELILTSDAENEFIGIEKLTDKELIQLLERCAKAAEKQMRMTARAKAEMSARQKRSPKGSKSPAKTARASNTPRKRPAPRQSVAQ